MEERHITLQVLLYLGFSQRDRMETEVECQQKEGSSLLSPMCLTLRRQRQVECLQEALQYNLVEVVMMVGK